MNNEEINKIKMYQMLLQEFHPLAVEELKILPLVYFQDASASVINFNKRCVTVTLRPYSGLKGFFNKFRYKSKHQKWASDLAKAIDFWLFPDKQSGLKPRIDIEWEDYEGH